MSKCLILCHLGLGDNVTMIGLCRYLTEYYEEIHLPCKEHNYKNVISFFEHEPKIKVFITTDNILGTLPNKWNDDIFNTSLLHRKDFNIKCSKQLKDFGKYNESDTFITKFYNKVNLPIRIYSEYFKLPNSEKSKELFELVKEYKIIFIHETSSNATFNIEKYIKDEIYNENGIIICCNRNYYQDLDENFTVKKEIAENFINIPLIDYIETIINANKIMVSDSCFSAMIIPMKMNKIIKTDNIYFLCRGGNDKVISFLLPSAKYL